MKDMIKTFKETPMETALAFAVVAVLFAAFYGVLYIGSAIGLQ